MRMFITGIRADDFEFIFLVCHCKFKFNYDWRI